MKFYNLSQWFPAFFDLGPLFSLLEGIKGHNVFLKTSADTIHRRRLLDIFILA